MRFKMSSAICFSLDQSEILSYGNGLKGKEWVVSGTKELHGNENKMYKNY